MSEQTPPLVVSTQDLMITSNLVELIRKTTNDVMTNVERNIPFTTTVEPVSSDLVGRSMEVFLKNRGVSNVK